MVLTHVNEHTLTLLLLMNFFKRVRRYYQKDKHFTKQV